MKPASAGTAPREPRAHGASRSAYIGVACTLIGAVAFSGKPVLAKLVFQHGVDVLTLLALRMLFALPLLIAMAWWAGTGGLNMTRRDWLAVVALGFTGYYIGSFLDFAGLQYISAGLGRLILYLYPTLVIALSALLLRQPIQGRHVLSLALSYGGIALVFREEARIGDDPGLVALGAGLVFASAVTYAIYLIAGSRIVHKMGSMRFTAYASSAATFFVLAHYFSVRAPGALVVPAEVYGLTLIMAVFSTVLPLWLLAEGLKRIGANQVALVGCIGPLSTIVLANLFLAEPVTPVQLAGAGLVLAGVMIISMKPQAARGA